MDNVQLRRVQSLLDHMADLTDINVGDVSAQDWALIDQAEKLLRKASEMLNRVEALK